jgi:hypothetical protein
MKADDTKFDIFCQQVLMHDASVFSIQWAVFPEQHAATLTPDFIMEKYHSFLRRVTLSLARPLWTADGLDFRLLSTKIHLLAFAAPIYSDTGGISSVTLHICGGHFVQREQCNRGIFSFMSEKIEGGVKVTVQLADYHPRLLGSLIPCRFRKLLYRLTQAFIHKIVTVNFLSYLYRELAGAKTSCRIVKAHVRSGEDI